MDEVTFINVNVFMNYELHTIIPLCLKHEHILNCLHYTYTSDYVTSNPVIKSNRSH